MLGYFPMAESRKNKNLVFIDPEYRALIPIEKFPCFKKSISFGKEKAFYYHYESSFPSSNTKLCHNK